MPPTLTPKHMLPSTGKRLSQMGGEMLNFPADDLADSFTPHLWPSVTFHAVAVSTWPAHCGCKGMLVGPEDGHSAFSYRLQRMGSPSQPRTDSLGTALGDGIPVERGPEQPLRIEGNQGSPKCLDSPKPPATLPISQLIPPPL